MLICYTEGKFPKEYVPTVFDNYEATIFVEGKEVKFSLWDTAGQEGYARIRTLSYPKTDIFLLAFSVANYPSFVNVKVRILGGKVGGGGGLFWVGRKGVGREFFLE